MATCKWRSYSFEIHQMEGEWNDIGGVYIFAYLSNPTDRLWSAVYIGQTKSFATRLPSHTEWEEAQLLGATHVHALSVGPAATRKRIEKELIEAFDPPLNEQS